MPDTVSTTEKTATSPSSDVAPGEVFDIDPIWAKKVVRKIDKRILVCCMITYTLNFVDKTLVGYSAIFGIITSTVRPDFHSIFRQEN